MLKDLIVKLLKRREFAAAIVALILAGLAKLAISVTGADPAFFERIVGLGTALVLGALIEGFPKKDYVLSSLKELFNGTKMKAVLLTFAALVVNWGLGLFGLKIADEDLTTLIVLLVQIAVVVKGAVDASTHKPLLA